MTLICHRFLAQGNHLHFCVCASHGVSVRTLNPITKGAHVSSHKPTVICRVAMAFFKIQTAATAAPYCTCNSLMIEFMQSLN